MSVYNKLQELRQKLDLSYLDLEARLKKMLTEGKLSVEDRAAIQSSLAGADKSVKSKLRVSLWSAVNDEERAKLMLEVGVTAKSWPAMYSRVISACVGNSVLLVGLLRQGGPSLGWDEILLASVKHPNCTQILCFLDKFGSLKECKEMFAVKHLVDSQMWDAVAFLVGKVAPKVLRGGFRYSSSAWKLVECKNVATLGRIWSSELTLTDLFAKCAERDDCEMCGKYHQGDDCEEGSTSQDYDYREDAGKLEIGDETETKFWQEVVKHPLFVRVLLATPLIGEEAFERIFSVACSKCVSGPSVAFPQSLASVAFSPVLSSVTSPEAEVLEMLLVELELNICDYPEYLNLLSDASHLQRVLMFATKKTVIDSNIMCDLMSSLDEDCDPRRVVEKLKMVLSCGLTADDILRQTLIAAVQTNSLEIIAVFDELGVKDWSSCVSVALDVEGLRMLRHLRKSGVTAEQVENYSMLAMDLKKADFLRDWGVSAAFFAKNDMKLFHDALAANNEEHIDFLVRTFGWEVGKEVVVAPGAREEPYFNLLKK